MNVRDFNAISIRGRMAYAICCLERAVSKFEGKNPTWDFLLIKLWMFTETTNIAGWQEVVAECIPGVILGGNYYDEFEFIEKVDIWKLSSLYRNTHIDLCRMIEAIFDIGTIETVEEGIEENSVQTLKALGTVIAICEKHSIDLPSTDIVKIYNFNEFSGWGKQFSRNELLVPEA